MPLKDNFSKYNMIFLYQTLCFSVPVICGIFWQKGFVYKITKQRKKADRIEKTYDKIKVRWF